MYTLHYVYLLDSLLPSIVCGKNDILWACMRYGSPHPHHTQPPGWSGQNKHKELCQLLICWNISNITQHREPPSQQTIFFPVHLQVQVCPKKCHNLPMTFWYCAAYKCHWWPTLWYQKTFQICCVQILTLIFTNIWTNKWSCGGQTGGYEYWSPQVFLSLRSGTCFS